MDFHTFDIASWYLYTTFDIVSSVRSILLSLMCLHKTAVPTWFT